MHASRSFGNFFLESFSVINGQQNFISVLSCIFKSVHVTAYLLISKDVAVCGNTIKRKVLTAFSAMTSPGLW